VRNTGLAETLDELFHIVPPIEVVPDAIDMEDAIATASQILQVDPLERSSFVAFRVDIDTPDAQMARISFSPRYRQLVMAGKKTTTVRRGQRSIRPGPALLCFGDQSELAGVVTAITSTTVRSLDDADALRDGFANRQELLAALRQHYPDLTIGEPVTILEFKWTT
jgi:uncharacterized protein YqfB (UPF0267 family)